MALKGRSPGAVYVLGPANTLGRDPENTIQVLDEKISRHHAVLRRSDGSWTLQDLGSRNGTFLGGQRVSGAITLKGGEEILLGDTLMRFELLASPAPGTARFDPLEPLDPSLPPPRTGVSGILVPAPPMQEAGRPSAKTTSEITVRNSARGSVDLDELEINPMVQAAADVSGKALFQATQGVSVEELSRRLAVSFEINKALSRLMDREDLAETLLEELFKAIPASRGAVLVSQAGDELEPLAVREPGSSNQAGRRIPISRTLLARAVSRREAVLMTDVLADTDLAGSASIVAQGIKSAITAPFIFRDEFLGVLHLEARSQSRSFSKADLDLVASVASQAAIALANARLLDRVKKEAEHRTNLQRYLAPELVEQLLQGRISMEMEGATAHATMLFSDLRGFTSMSERTPGREVFRSLNSYFQQMVDVVVEFGGSIDKFMGDAIMAVWGIPNPREDDAVRAVTAAIKMQQALVAFNLEREAHGKPPFHMGVGINSGPVLAGNLGARQRMEYTVIGDNVNLASRLQGLTGAGQILISESTMALVRQVVNAVELPPAKVKGKQHPVKVFEVRGLLAESSSGGEDEAAQRSHGRVRTSVRVALVNEATGTVHVGVLTDISAGGAGVKFLPEQIRGLEQGASVRLPFGARSEKDAPSVRGKVVRLIHGADKAGNVLFKAGIQFLDPPELVKDLARSLVSL